MTLRKTLPLSFSFSLNLASSTQRPRNNWHQSPFDPGTMATDSPARGAGTGDRSHTPPRMRRGRSSTRCNGREIIVQERLVREPGGTGPPPMLTATNYIEWALVMQVQMEAAAL